MGKADSAPKIRLCQRAPPLLCARRNLSRLSPDLHPKGSRLAPDAPSASVGAPMGEVRGCGSTPSQVGGLQESQGHLGPTSLPSWPPLLRPPSTAKHREIPRSWSIWKASPVTTTATQALLASCGEAAEAEVLGVPFPTPISLGLVKPPPPSVNPIWEAGGMFRPLKKTKTNKENYHAPGRAQEAASFGLEAGSKTGASGRSPPRSRNRRKKAATLPVKRRSFFPEVRLPH